MSTVAEGVLPIQGAAPDSSFPSPAFPVARLIPASVADAKRISRSRNLALAGIGVAVLAVGALWMTTSSQTAEAEEQLSDSQATAGLLAAQQAKYAELPRLASQIQSAQADVQAVLGPEVLWSSVLGKLAAAAPSGVTINKVTGSLPVTAAGQPASSAVGTGNVTVGGKALTFPQVSAWLDALAKQKIFVAPNLIQSARDDSTTTPSVSFENSVGLSAAAKSGRYVAKESK
ncbi:MAG: PilN domain-containing protein [Actinomycetes bacterium]